MSKIDTPAALLKDLDVDKMVDTTLAQNYFEKHNFEFQPVSLEYGSAEEFKLDSQRNKIYGLGKSVPRQKIEGGNPVDKRKLLSTIASEIESNAELFAQIAYLTRNSKMDDIKKYDIKLIANQFRCYAAEASKTPPLYCPVSTVHPYIWMLEEEPLAVLADVARSMVRGDKVHINYSLDCAALCHLFVELCFKAGCATDALRCYYRISFPVDTSGQLHVEGSTLGSVAVVTEKTNMESAVSAVVDATGDPKYPWRLTRVIVQECVYERFKRTLQNKIKRQNVHTPPPPEHLISKADLILVYENKTFLIDYVGTLSDDGEILKESYVQVEAYRTTKELLSLLNVYQPSYLSLWCSDVSISNEIAFGIKPCTVWLNDLGVFEGPKDICQSFVLHQVRLNMFRTRVKQKITEDPRLTQFMKLSAEWINRDVQYRREAVSKALEMYLIGNNDRYTEVVKEMLKLISDWGENTSFTHVQNGRLCIGIYEPRGLVYIPALNPNEAILEVFKSVILGNGVLLEQYLSPNPLVLLCAKEGVPIATVDLNQHVRGFDITSDAFYKPLTLSERLYTKRIIMSHFGETFAN